MSVQLLTDKKVIVTGAAQGIGKAIALEIAQRGATVGVVDISDKIEDVTREIRGLGVEGISLKCDVSNFDDVQEKVKTFQDKYGKVDVLVNNAGIYPFKPFLEMTKADWDKVIGINLNGAFNFVKAVLSGMIEDNFGKIVNISSVAGEELGYSNLVHYSASKSAIIGFTRSLALEVANKGVRVNSICPGAIETPGATGQMNKEQYEAQRKSIPLQRFGKPVDIANMVLFLISEDADYITGQCFVVDGGLTIAP